MTKFNELGLSPELETTIRRMGLKQPTRIQSETIPLILQKKDIIGESATGSGKTLAFGCGLLNRMKQNKRIQGLVLTPTRELAQQVMEMISQLSSGRRMNVLAVYGGVSMGKQIRSLRRTDIVIATPGRLLDHIRRQTIDLGGVKLLVLDEADRMLDMGFIGDVEEIMKHCPKNRQTLFFSATISKKIKKLGNNYMNNPTTIVAEKLVDPTKLEQVYIKVPKKKKMAALLHMLGEEDSGRVMVFCNTRHRTDFVTKNLNANGNDAITIHGGLTQRQRSNTIDIFNRRENIVMACTDVAARGLHIDRVSHIYNYDIPILPNDYVHRIGRTARAGRSGKVINILCDKYDTNYFQRILKKYREFEIKKVDIPNIKMMEVKKGEFQKRKRDRAGNKFRGKGENKDWNQRKGRGRGRKGGSGRGGKKFRGKGWNKDGAKRWNKDSGGRKGGSGRGGKKFGGKGWNKDGAKRWKKDGGEGRKGGSGSTGKKFRGKERKKDGGEGRKGGSGSTGKKFRGKGRKKDRGWRKDEFGHGKSTPKKFGKGKKQKKFKGNFTEKNKNKRKGKQKGPGYKFNNKDKTPAHYRTRN